MKRSTLLAGVLGVLVVGGGVYAVRRTTSSTSSSAASPQPTPTSPSTAPITATPTERPSMVGTTSDVSASSTAPAASAAAPDRGGAVETPALSPEAAERATARGVDPTAAAAAAPSRTGEKQLRPIPPAPNQPLTSESAALVRQKQFKRTTTRAACLAPDIGQRVAQLPADAGRQLIDRCAAVGVTVTAAKD